MIRRATVEDLAFMYGLIEQYHEEATEKGYRVSFKWEKVLNQLWTWLHSKSGVIILAEHGMLAGEIQEMWFGESVAANLIVCFVERKHRNGITARRLINHFNEIAIERGAIFSYWDDWAGITEGDMLETYLEKLGYRTQGNVYLKELPPYAVHSPVHSPYRCCSGPAVS